MKTTSSLTPHLSSKLTMESLALPVELIWDGKAEPASPSSRELFSIAELPSVHWLYDDNLANELISITVDDLDLKCMQELGHVEDLIVEFRDFKEENWTDSKLHVPLDYPIGSTIAHPNPITKVPVPLNFEIFKTSTPNCAETILTQLTPPHSPPQNGAVPTLLAVADATAIPTGIFQQQEQQQQPTNLGAVNFEHDLIAMRPAPLVHNQQFNNYPAWIGSSIGSAVGAINAAVAAAATSTDDYSDDLMALDVDEFLQNRVKELDDGSNEYASLGSWPSHSQASSVISDDDWQPSCSSSAASSPTHQSLSSNSSSCSNNDADDERPDVALATRMPKKRTRPYGRGIEDRKIRKKEQNKNAATRYRQKKKIEMETVHSEEQELNARNVELKRILDECTREAKYLRGLIREFHQKKP